MSEFNEDIEDEDDELITEFNAGFDVLTNGIEVGDLITAYHAGFHVVTEVVRRFVTEADVRHHLHSGKQVGDEYSALIKYRTVLTKKYTPPRSQQNKACDAAFCEKLTRQGIEQQRQKKLEDINTGYDVLLQLFDAAKAEQEAT